MAVGIELCLLFSPYASFFSISVTPRFVAVTLAAHVVFGLSLGAYYAWHSGRWRQPWRRGAVVGAAGDAGPIC
jgi:hypothetical protein